MSLFITFEGVAKNEAEKTNRNTNAKVSYDEAKTVKGGQNERSLGKL